MIEYKPPPEIPKPRTISEAWQLVRAYIGYRWHEYLARAWRVEGPELGDALIRLEIACFNIELAHMVADTRDELERLGDAIQACVDSMAHLGEAVGKAMSHEASAEAG